eukprot:scaffold4306_cov114-Isochrysis_galbana.AAC.7
MAPEAMSAAADTCCCFSPMKAPSRSADPPVGHGLVAAVQFGERLEHDRNRPLARLGVGGVG